MILMSFFRDLWEEEKTYWRRTPCEPMGPVSKTIATVALGVPAAVVVGLLAGKIVHSKQGKYMARSLVRGVIYRACFSSFRSLRR
jgi:hypothetical protein